MFPPWVDVNASSEIPPQTVFHAARQLARRESLLPSQLYRQHVDQLLLAIPFPLPLYASVSRVCVHCVFVNINIVNAVFTCFLGG